MGEKIIELQGVRCIAIISVLLFHIWPETFGNGFLGVDIFFVVSGYIMAMILLSSNSLKDSFFKTTLKFYYRRIYRILPLYLFNILITIFLAPSVSYTVYYFNFLSQIKSALTFSTNFAMFFEDASYFNQALSFTGFKHYWSLCVEMQFYAIVPFLLYFSKRLPLLVSLFLLWPLMIGGCVFLIFYMLINYGQHGAQFTFTMLPARIYEFVGGFVAFNVQQAIDLYFNNNQIIFSAIKKIINSVITVNILTLSLIMLSLYPVKLVDVYTLPATVILTSALIASIGRPKEKNEMRYSLLANKFCIFVGDASYSLYICHWIIVFLGKLLYGDDELHRIIILITCAIIGVAVHLYIEKPIIKARLKPEVFLPWVIVAYLAIGYTAYSNEFKRSISKNTQELFHNKSILSENVTTWYKRNLHIHPDISAEIGVYSWKDLCNNNGTEWKGNGTLKVLILGNSHALCIVPGVKLAMNKMYSHLKLFDIPGSIPFEGFKNAWQLPEIRETVKTFKPDIIYLIFKYMGDFEDPPPIAAIDHRVQTIQKMIDFLSANSNVLFISKMHFEAPRFSSLHFAEQIYRNGWASDYRIKQKDIEDSHAISTRRWEQIKCNKCIFIDMLEAFCKNGWCSPLDESQKVPLLFDDDHVNKIGSQYLGYHLQKYFDPMYKFLNVSSLN